MSKEKLGIPAVISAIASNPEATKKVVDTTSKVAKAVTIVGVLAGLFVSYKVYRFFYPDKGAGAQDLADQQAGLNDITTNFNSQSVAESLTHYLGTKYPTWDPRHWTESDEKVADLIIATKDKFIEISQLYAVLVGRNLRSDLIQMLDESELNRVRQYLNI